VVAGWFAASSLGLVQWPGLARLDVNIRVLVALAFALAGVLVTMTFYFLALNARELHRELRAAQRSLEGEILRRVALAAEVELLSALKSVSRIVSNQSSLEAVLSAVAGVLDHLIAPEEIIIFACPEETGGNRPIPVLKKTPEGMRFMGDIGDALDDSMALRCIAGHGPQRTSDGETLTSCTPLVADGEIIGALQLTMPIGGAREERIYRAERLDEVLDDIAKHVALTLKTISLSKTAKFDRLTGLANRGQFQHDIDMLFKRAKEHGQRLALIMVDIDHFKKFNDTYGHQTGDAVLARVGELIRDNLRRYDTAYRYGGEEIAVITARSGVREAGVLAERIRKRVERASFASADHEALSVTISLGVAEVDRSMNTPKDLVRASDRALYRAKSQGRNLVFVAESEKRPISS